MMRSTFLRWCSIAALSLFCLGLAPAQDDDTQSDAEPKKEKKLPKGLKAVGQALAVAPTFNAEPNLKAKYYIYLVSAASNDVCQELLPKVVEAYPAMKKKGVEILLICVDDTKEAAQNNVKKHECPFPAVWWADNPRKEDYPGLTAGLGIPFVAFVTPQGEKIVSGNAISSVSGILAWKDILFGKKKPKKKK